MELLSRYRQRRSPTTCRTEHRSRHYSKQRWSAEPAKYKNNIRACRLYATHKRLTNILRTCEICRRLHHMGKVFTCGHNSSLQTAATEVVQWTANNKMALNYDKTMELRICFKRSPLDIPPLTIEQVKSTRLLGVTQLT